MCLLLLQDHNSDPIPDELFKKIWTHNYDGFGLGWLGLDNKFYSQKTLFQNKALDAYHDLFTKKLAYAWKIVHFRFKTHGTICEDNCHPFVAGPNILLAHNGTITIPYEEKKDYPQDWSDTRYFASILGSKRPEPDKTINSPANSEFINKYLGGSRLVTIEAGARPQDAEALYWGFPKQEDEYKKYGVFSTYNWVNGKRTFPVRSTTNYGGYSYTGGRTTDYRGRFRNLGLGRDLVAEFPTVWFVVDILMNEPDEPWMNIMSAFYQEFKRHMTAPEIETAFTAATEILETEMPGASKQLPTPTVAEETGCEC